MKTPEDYRCSKCDIHGVKLWRQYQRIASAIDLMCVSCAQKDQDAVLNFQKGDQIGSLVPAVPVEDTYWGYTSVPEEGVQWWKALPLFRNPMWTLDSALSFIRDLQPYLREVGYAAALGGSVLNHNASQNDLDIIIHPLDTMRQSIDRLKGALQEQGLTLKVPVHVVHYEWRKRHKSYDQKFVEKWEDSEGRKIDFFLLS